MEQKGGSEVSGVQVGSEEAPDRSRERESLASRKALQERPEGGSRASLED